MADGHTTNAERERRLGEYVAIASVVVLTSMIAIILLGTQLGDVLSLIAERIHE